MYEDKLVDYLPEFTEALARQLEEDEKRWGDTWKKRLIYGQEMRAPFGDSLRIREEAWGSFVVIMAINALGKSIAAWTESGLRRPTR